MEQSRLFLVTVVAPALYLGAVQLVWWSLHLWLPLSDLAWLGFLLLSTAAAAYLFSRSIWARIRAAQQRVLAERERWDAFADNAPQAILILGTDGRVRSANRTAGSVLGRVRSELVGVHCSEFGLCPRCTAGQAGSACPVEGLGPGQSVRRHVTLRPAAGDGFPADVAFVSWVADGERQVAVAIEDLRAYRQLQEEVLVLGERNRLAREFHDGLGQMLGILSLRLDQARRESAAGRREGAESELAACAELVGTAFHEVRRAIADLTVPLATGRRFFSMLRSYLNDYKKNTGIEVDPVFSVADDLQLAPAAEVQLIRIIQEALTNVRRHASTAKAQVLVDRTNGGPLVIAVSDNGIGFRPDAAPQDGFGLASMRERAELLGGTCSVQSQPGRGTRVVVMLPMGGETT